MIEGWEGRVVGSPGCNITLDASGNGLRLPLVCPDAVSFFTIVRLRQMAAMGPRERSFICCTPNHRCHNSRSREIATNMKCMNKCVLMCVCLFVCLTYCFFFVFCFFLLLLL